VLKIDIFTLIKGCGDSVGMSYVCRPDSNHIASLLLSAVRYVEIGELSKKATSSRVSAFSTVMGTSSGIGLKRSTGRDIGVGVGIAVGTVVAVGESTFAVEDGSTTVALLDDSGVQLLIKTAISTINSNLFFILNSLLLLL
jgi:hypothetical protein